jgi:KGK domain
VKPKEILPDVNRESIIRIADDICLTLDQFREIITKATISMKVNYVESLMRQGYHSFVDDVRQGDRFTMDGVLVNNENQPYKDIETGEPFEISDFQWFNSGEDCKILQPGETWQEGQFRLHITAEFIPKDAPADRPIESSLDDFRGSLSS